jgi:hypothetical protein
MVEAVSSPRGLTYSAEDARQARDLLRITVALQCARRLRADGRKLGFDSRGGLRIDPPLDSDQIRRYAGSAAVLERLLSSPLKHWAEYIDAAAVFLEQLVAVGARPREAAGRLVADLPNDANARRMRMLVDFYSSAAVKLLRADAILRAEEERNAPWWRRALAWR